MCSVKESLADEQMVQAFLLNRDQNMYPCAHSYVHVSYSHEVDHEDCLCRKMCHLVQLRTPWSVP